jgi:two-component system phosphate regulon response regulator OmpR
MISTMAGERVLIVDDDADIRESTGEYLAGHGFRTAFAADGEQMREAVGAGAPDVVLLDLNLPGEDGLSLARWLRRHHDVAIIMITGAADVVDRVIAWKSAPTTTLRNRSIYASCARGCAACCGEPGLACWPQLRRRSVPPRSAFASGAASSTSPRTSCSAPTARNRDHQHRLRPAEGVRRNANRVLSRDQLLTMTSNREWEPFDRAIDIRIARLRRKIESDPENPGVIRTVRGAGYMFVSS